MLEKDARQPTTSQNTKPLLHHLVCSKLANSSGWTQHVGTEKDNRDES